MRAAFAVLLMCVASTYAADSKSVMANLHNTIIGAINVGIQAMVQQFLALIGGRAGERFFIQVINNMQEFANAQIAVVQQSINNAQSLFNNMVGVVTGNKPQAKIMDHINQAISHTQELLSNVANQLIAGVLAGLGMGQNPRFWSTITGAVSAGFNAVVDTVSTTVTNIGTAVGQVVTGVVETAQPHIDNLVVELQGHAENAVQSLVNTIAGINQGIGY